LPKQLSLFGTQKCLYFEKIGIAFLLQIVHFVLQMRLFGLQLSVINNLKAKKVEKLFKTAILVLKNN